MITYGTQWIYTHYPVRSIPVQLGRASFCLIDIYELFDSKNEVRRRKTSDTKEKVHKKIILTTVFSNVSCYGIFQLLKINKNQDIRVLYLRSNPSLWGLPKNCKMQSWESHCLRSHERRECSTATNPVRTTQLLLDHSLLT